MDNSNRLKILQENYRECKSNVEGGRTLKQYTKLCAASDPTFFNWFFPNADNIDSFGAGMTDEQKEEYELFLETL